MPHMHVEYQPSTINPLVVGVDIGGTQIRAALLAGSTILARVQSTTGKDMEQDELLKSIQESILLTIKQSGKEVSDIRAIGIAIPGVVNGREGIVHTSPNLPHLRDFPVAARVQQMPSLPVAVANDANVAALGEYVYGAGKGSAHMVFITVSTGIGAGIVVDGAIFEGVRGAAGELGHMTIEQHGKQCPCGNVGCLEMYASGTAIASAAQIVLSQGQADDLQSYMEKNKLALPITARMLNRAAQEGIVSVQRILREAGESLGVGLVNALHLFNPDTVVLGGGVIQFGDVFMQPAFQWVHSYAMKPISREVHFEIALLGQDAGLIGAGVLASQMLLSKGG